MTTFIEIWETKADYEYHREWNGLGKEPNDCIYSTSYENFDWLFEYVPSLVNTHKAVLDYKEFSNLVAIAMKKLKGSKGNERKNLKLFSDEMYDVLLKGNVGLFKINVTKTACFVIYNTR